jgi:2-oxoglutarate ferredoxin oxidoreductase subunit alpha
MYDFTIRAFKLSERFRTPVVLLSDEIVGHMREKLVIGRDPIPDFPDWPVPVGSPSEDFFTGASTMVEGQLHDDQGRRIGHLATQSGDFTHHLCSKIQDHMDEMQYETYFMEDSGCGNLAYGCCKTCLNAVKQARE